MGSQSTRGAAVVAVAVSALVAGWATAQQDRRTHAEIDATVLDTARLKQAGFVPAPFPGSKPPPDHGRYFKRFSDGATFEATWNVYTPETANKAWNNRRSMMAGDRTMGQRLPSGKPLHGEWMAPPRGPDGGAYRIYAIHQGVIVNVMVHYGRTPRIDGYQWIVKNAQRDERLVEEITRSLMAKLAVVPPMDTIGVPQGG
jgi:hypothetical protein